MIDHKIPQVSMRSPIRLDQNQSDERSDLFGDNDESLRLNNSVEKFILAKVVHSIDVSVEVFQKTEENENSQKSVDLVDSKVIWKQAAFLTKVLPESLKLKKFKGSKVLKDTSFFKDETVLECQRKRPTSNYKLDKLGVSEINEVI